MIRRFNILSSSSSSSASTRIFLPGSLSASSLLSSKYCPSTAATAATATPVPSPATSAVGNVSTAAPPLVLDHRWDHIRTILSSLGNTTTTYTIHPYQDTGAAYLDMWDAVDAAKRSVIWHTYIAKDDKIGKVTIDKLVAAAKRGVNVEFLYDCGGNMTGRSSMVAPLTAAGAKVVRYRPFFPGFGTYFFRGPHWRLSPAVRNHRKILVVDDEVGFTGGLNIGCEYAGTSAGGTGKFRDSHCKVTGADGVRMLRDACIDTVQPQPGPVQRALRWRQWAQKTWAMRVQERKERMAEQQQQQSAAPSSPSPKEFRAKAKSFYERRRSEMMQKLDALAARFQANNAGGESVISPASAAAGSSPDSEPKQKLRTRIRKQLRELASKNRRSITIKRSSGGSIISATARNRVSSLKSRWAQLKDRHVDSSRDGRQQQLSEAFQRFQRKVSRAAEQTRILKALAQKRTAALSKRVAATAAPSRSAAAAAAAAIDDLQEDSVAETQTDTTKIIEIRDAHQVLHRMAVDARACFAQVLLANPLSENWSLQMALWLVVRRSAGRVWVTTPYFIPHRKLVRATIEAAQRGVDVRILTGSKGTTDPWFMWYAQQYLSHRLLKSGVKLYEYQGGAVMHAKTVVVDGMWSSVGSYNWDILSNKLMEISVAALDPKVAATMEEHFKIDMAKSEHVVEDTFLQRSFLVRVMCRFVYYGLKLAEWCSFAGYGDKDLTSKID